MSRPDVAVAGRYRLVEQIASGGMGSVWEAWDERLQRRVALKQLHPQPGLSPAEAKLAGDRAMREARITARLHHPHAVPVYDVVDFDGQPCLIMQYLPSKSLQALIKERGVIDAGEVARIGAQVAGALAAAHQVGIVHRDVKPANVLIDGEGSAKITDFGISHAVGDVALTSTGMVTGTPAFLAPEVARGVESGAAADVFSLGSTLYAALEGSPPFGTEENPMAMLHRVASGQIIPPRRTGPLTDTLMRMLAADPDARPAMSEIADRLARVDRTIVDPATGEPTHRIDRTQRMAPPPPPVEPPTTTVTLPAVAPRAATPPPPVAPALIATAPPGRPRRNRTGVAAAVAAVLLVLGLAAVLAVQLLGDDSGGNGSAAGSHSGASHGAPTRHTTARTTTQQSQQASSTPPASAKASDDSSGGNGGGNNNGGGNGDAAGTPVAAVQRYYSLLPGGTDDAWKLLTSSFQNGRAGGRATYNDYWGQIRSVTVGDLSSTGASSVQALITYTYKSGKVVSERTNFGLVDQGGTWLINSTG